MARLSQVFSNLIANAVQHGDPGGGVTVRVDGSEQDRVTIAVHNTGTIPPDLVPRMFEPLAGRERRRDGSRGLGLGLYITHEIVRAHGGAIEVVSNEAEGTTFTVSLPRSSSRGHSLDQRRVPIPEPRRCYLRARFAA